MKPFWESKTLSALTHAEWEALCDGCGLCCLVKLEDAETGEVHYTDVACRLLDLDSCRCRDYPHRAKRVPDCLSLTPEVVAECSWLPATCAYRLRREGRALPSWHPLVSGDPDAVHRTGISVRGRVRSEEEVSEEALLERVVHWVPR
ncbi:MAG: UPF0260 protein [Porticoccaceae bacterium]|nr:MAG: UPF0260 protein [Porticoccaceae bacterium]